VNALPVTKSILEDTLRAVVCTHYGPPEVLQLKEVEKPVCRDNEVLIKVHATAVTSGDCRCRGLTIPAHFSILTRLAMRLALGITRPRKPILGLVLAGEVETAGKGVTRFKAGDQVFGETGMRFGAYAEYTCLSETAAITIKPANITYEEAAAVPFGGSTALYFLRKGKIRKGQTVLVYGASGAVGTFAVQLARYFGADVTGVCSTANVELVKSLGAHTVIDYTKEDFAERNERYDLIFDAVGKTSESLCRKALAPNGMFVSVMKGHAGENTEDLVLLKELVESGNIRPVIDRCYPLDQIVEAHRYVEQGHKKGNVVIRVAQDEKER
jgi:NADPH:quinone reductase-like Zn-dependent oxidoreductase